MKMASFKDGSKAMHRDHGVGTIHECTDPDYVYFTADLDKVKYFAYRGYLTPIKEH